MPSFYCPPLLCYHRHLVLLPIQFSPLLGFERLGLGLRPLLTLAFFVVVGASPSLPRLSTQTLARDVGVEVEVGEQGRDAGAVDDERPPHPQGEVASGVDTRVRIAHAQEKLRLQTHTRHGIQKDAIFPEKKLWGYKLLTMGKTLILSLKAEVNRHFNYLSTALNLLVILAIIVFNCRKHHFHNLLISLNALSLVAPNLWQMSMS